MHDENGPPMGALPGYDEYGEALIARDQAQEELQFWQLVYMAAVGHGEKDPAAWAAMACRDREEKVKELGLDKEPPTYSGGGFVAGYIKPKGP